VAAAKNKPRAGAGTAGAKKKSKTYRLSEGKIAAAQEILGAKTATATIEAALDMVVFRKELVDGTAALGGLQIAAFDRG